MRLPLASIIVSLMTFSVSAFASANFYECEALGEPSLKMALTVTPKGDSPNSIPQKVSMLIDDGQKIIADEATFAYYEGFDNQNFVLGGVKTWVSEIQGANAYSGYVYLPGSLLKTGEGQVALYRSYYRSKLDCGNESQWFNCKRD